MSEEQTNDVKNDSKLPEEINVSSGKEQSLPTVSQFGNSGKNDAPAELPLIKDYNIIKELSEGEMDIVFLAEP